MKEYIERAALKRELAPYEENDFSQQMDVILAIVGSQPAANVVEVRHGRWLEYDGADKGFHYCSECKRQAFNYEGGEVVVEVLSDWCPHCGARIDKEDEHEAG